MLYTSSTISTRLLEVPVIDTLMAQTLSSSPIQPVIPPSSPKEDDHALQDYCRAMIKGFFTDCEVPYYIKALDQNLFKTVCDTASEKGCPMSGPLSIAPYLHLGASIGSIAYEHQEPEIQLFAALYTAYATYIDDMGGRDASLINKFVEVFALHQSHGHPVLDAFAEMLLEMPKKFDKLISDLMVAASLNFINGCLLEAELLHVSIPPTAYEYANYVRTMSGVPDPYSLFIFPQDLPRASFIHALPDIGTFINFANDILSFYKEELQGDCANYVSIMASVSGTSKQDVLKDIISKLAAAYNRAMNTLSPNPKALEAFKRFAYGYIAFHASDPRYKLAELGM